MKNEMVKIKVKTILSMASKHCKMLSTVYEVAGRTLANPQFQDLISNTAAVIVAEVESCVEQIKSNEDLRHDFEQAMMIVKECEEEINDIKAA